MLQSKEKHCSSTSHLQSKLKDYVLLIFHSVIKLKLKKDSLQVFEGVF